MKYLLDTHALWHHASNGDGLSKRAGDCIDQARIGDLLILDVSLNELARHMGVGRIEVNSPLQSLKAIENAYPLLCSDAEIVWKSASLNWPKRRGGSQHLDPADRAIVATALIHQLTIITADKEIHHFADRNQISVLW